MKILGIETSCDDTSVAVVEDGHKLLSLSIATSADLHAAYGGIVPEVAARNHIEVIIPTIEKALLEAECNWSDIDAIAVTYGAGLGGSLLIGVTTARTLAICYDKPLIPVNHVEAHLYANFINESSVASVTPRKLKPEFPMLGVIISGGHTQLVYFEDHFKYQLLGQTQDDAIGEAFDKVAKILGLPYPGGPALSKIAQQGDHTSYKLPKPRMSGYDFSYSGLKTAVLRLAQNEIGESYDFPSIMLSERLSEAQKANIAASFQHIAVELVVDRVKQAISEFAPRSIVIGGGVSANSELRKQLSLVYTKDLEFPDLKLCTDNGAMVATLGYYQIKYAQTLADPYTLDIAPNLSM
jgi:N6-L-threonylcarbamoyladenine synthase